MKGAQTREIARFGSGRKDAMLARSSDSEECLSGISALSGDVLETAVPTRVFVLESTPMACDLLSRALLWSGDDLAVVGTATGMDKVDLSKVAEADVILISLELSEGQIAGLTLVRRLAKANDPVHCVIIMDEAERSLVVEAFRAGAVGVYERSQPACMLGKCIRSVGKGQIWANSQQLRYVVDALRSPARVRISSAKGELLLTPREDEIASLIAEGLKNREIATRLSISENTVKNHVFHIFEKLGISTRAELILYVSGR